MERNLLANAKVRGPKQNLKKQQEPARKSVATGSKRIVRSSPKGKGQESREILSRLITTMRPGPAYPPDFDNTPVHTITRRFQSAENIDIATRSFTLAWGHRQFGVVIDAVGNCKCYADVWRIKKIRVFCNNYVDNATTVTIQPITQDLDTNCFNDREAGYTCSSRSEAMPGHMEVVPARDTPLGSWHKTSTLNTSGGLFNITVDYGGASSGNWATITMDIVFEYTVNLIGLPQGYTWTCSLGAGATSGTLGGSDIFSSAMIVQGVNELT